MALIRGILLLLVVTLTDIANGQSKYPPCEGADSISWHKCLGVDRIQGIGWYVGEYFEGKKSGRAAYIFDNGESYAGLVFDGKRSGWGANFFKNGRRYSGYFSEDLYNGVGIFLEADGRSFVGNWKNGKPNGAGIQYDSDKKILRSGDYIDGKLVTPSQVDPKPFTGLEDYLDYLQEWKDAADKRIQAVR